MMQHTEKKSVTLPALLVGIALVVMTCAAYWQVGNHEFLIYDDDVYIVRNAHVSQGLSGANIIWAFTSVEQCNWHPLTWLSHMLDVELYGMNSRGHHLTNVALHCVATLLLLFLLLRLTGKLWQSAFVAALFALHPLHVESVAWAAERKDLLSACLFFSTLLLYARYVETRQNGRSSGVAPYLLTLVSFILGLMAKPMLVTVPLVLLLLDYWPLRRMVVVGNDDTTLSRRLIPLIKEKIPFFACSLLASAITIYAQRSGGAMVTLDWIPVATRLKNALVSYPAYLLKTLWPHDLAVLYPFSLSIPLWQVICSVVVLILVTAASLWGGRRNPWLPVGWFWFIITLVPVIGLVQVGNQSMADRYMYLPAVGLFIIVAWGVPSLLQAAFGRVLPVVIILSACAVIGAAGLMTWRQAGYWQNNISLYQHALEVTTANFVITYNLGLAYGRAGRPDEAIRAFQAAVLIKPMDTKVRNLLASTLAETGNIDRAIAEFSTSLTIKPNDSEARNSLEFWRNQKEKQKTHNILLPH